MKKKGKYVLVIGAVVVALLMVSSACAVNVVSYELNSTEKTIQKNNVTYPTNLIEEKGDEKYLTKNAIPYLTLSFIQESDLEWKQTYLQIIQTINKKGIIDEDNIKNILEQNNLGIWDIYIGTSVTTPSFRSGGYIFSMPGLLRCIFLMFVSKGGIVTWNAVRTNRVFPTIYYDPEVKVGDTLYNYHHFGRSVGFFGWAMNLGFINPFEGHSFDIDGFALIVFVR